MDEHERPPEHDGAWEHGGVAAEFERHRPRLTAVALRLLGSRADADDAVQETWLRLSRSDAAAIENMGGWLTTVVARQSLNTLRARSNRREYPLDQPVPALMATDPGPEDEAVRADSIGLALLVVLDSLAPAERLAFVLHDLFGVPFDEVGEIVGRSPAAARQLASRARRRVQGSAQPAGDVDPTRQRDLVRAFLAASRAGDFEALLRLLAPDVVLRADATAVGFGADAEVCGPRPVAQTFAGRAQAARAALLDGVAGAIWMQGGQRRVAFAFSSDGDHVTAIELIADPSRLAAMDVAFFR